MDFHICNDIQDALKLSKEWQFPLLVFVHEKLKEPAADATTLAADIPGLYDTLPRGQKTLSMTFQLSSTPLAGDGLAQRLALEAILKESRLGLVSFVHFIEAGSPAHELFTAAVGNGNSIVPRLHIFPSSQRELPPAVLHGASLNSLKICEMIRVPLQMPTLTKIPDAQREFMGELDLMNAATRQQQQENRIGASSAAHSPHFASPSAESATASPLSGESACRAPAGLHFIALHGLEKKKVILTSPGMTLRTMWQQVCQSLESEAVNAKEVGIPCRGTRFELCVESQPAEIMVRSVEEASKMDIHELPHNTVVRVVIPDKNTSGGDGAPAASLTSSKPSGHPNDAMRNPLKKTSEREEATNNKPRVQCDGDSCRLEAPRTEFTNESEAQPKTQPQPQPQPTEGESALIIIRCLLPDGAEHVVSGMDPSLATIAGNLRDPVAAALGHDKFLFASPYPLRRYTPEEETLPLRSLGIGGSSALRVMVTSRPAANAAPQPAAQPAQNDSSRGLFGIVSALLSQVRSGGPLSSSSSSSAAAAGAAATGVTPTPTAAATTTTTNVQVNRTAGGGRFRTMAEIRAAEEEEERRAALEEFAQEQSQDMNRRKKMNRYYGGNATEFVGGDKSDESEDTKDQNDGKKGDAADFAKKNK